MKRIGHIYERICDLNNIKYAIAMAAKHKHNNPIARRVLDNLDAAAVKLQAMLVNRQYTPSPYFIETICDGVAGKTRDIYKPKFFPDQCVHWAVMLQVQPLIMRGMYDWSCGSIPGRGMRRCQQGCERWLRGDPKGTKYCLKLDVSKFYQSVDNDVLKAALRQILKDRDALAVLDAIIDSAGHGLTIGNYTSQWLANFYLQGLDHYIKEQLHVQYYARYIDDLVLFGGNKKELHKARRAVFDYIENRLKMRVKSNWQLFLVTVARTRRGRTYHAGRAVDFLGYRMDHQHTTIRRRTALRIMRRARKIAKKPAPTIRDALAMTSYNGILAHCNSYRFRRTRIDPYISMAKMRRMIAQWARKQATGPRNPHIGSRDTRTRLTGATSCCTPTRNPPMTAATATMSTA